MFKNKAMLLIASSLLAMPALIQAQGLTPTAGGKGGTVAAEQIIERYKTFAGSEANAKSLVTGLRTGGEITLIGPEVQRPPQKGDFIRTTNLKTGTQPPSDGNLWEKVGTTPPVFGPCPPPQSGMCVTTFDIYNVYKLTPGGLFPGEKTTFSPGPAAPMGFGNVDIALALTEAKLRPVATPAPEDLKTNLLEILDKRAGGQGWGDIAKGYGFELK